MPLYTTADSKGREVLSSDVQYFIKAGMSYEVDRVENTIGWRFTLSGRSVIRVDSTTKTPPEATDPTTFDIPSDDMGRIYAETITGRPTLGNGTAEVVYDGALMQLLGDWAFTGYGRTTEDNMVSVAMYSKRTGMIRIYPRVELLMPTAGSASSDNTYMTMTINFARRDRELYDDAFSVFPSGSNIIANYLTVPDWSAINWLGFTTYAQVQTLFMEPS